MRFMMNIYSDKVNTVARLLVLVGLLSLCDGVPGRAADVPAPGASATVSGEITCLSKTVTLLGASPTTGVVYTWAGPGGFTSNQANPQVSVPGTYVLTVSHAGSTSTAAVTVRQNTQLPGVVAGMSAALTCKAPAASLSAVSAAPGVTYRWTGPHGYASMEQNPATTLPGIYTVHVTNPVNGCMSEATVTLPSDVDAPADVTTSVSGAITCAMEHATLTGASSTPGVVYQWTGPGGFTGSGQQVSAKRPGVYNLTVTKPSSGCVVTSLATVDADKAAPEVDIIKASSGFILDCNTSATTLSCFSTTSGATYDWFGPEGYRVNGPMAVVTVPGAYVFTATGRNGCTRQISRNISKDKMEPPVAVASASGVLTCVTPAVTLNGAAHGAVSYSWSGPSGFTSTLQAPVVSAEGEYTLSVSSPAGCTGMASITVQRNVSAPADIKATASGILRCAQPTVMLQTASTTAGATYRWLGPNGFESTERSAETNVPGAYILRVTHPATGCTAVTNLTVSGEKCQSLNK
jgi:hypothetical protein